MDSNLEATTTLDVRVVAVSPLLNAEWEALATGAGYGLFGRAEWFERWAAAFTAGKLHCLTARRAGRLVALLPVVPDGATLRSATNPETRRYLPIVSEPGLLGPIVAVLPGPFRRLSLSYLPAAELAGLLGPCAGNPSGPLVISREMRRSPYLATVGVFEAWEEERLSAKRRKTFRRLRRRLEELGDVRLEVTDGGPQIQRILDEGFALEAKGWKGVAGTAVNANPPARRFYDDIAACAASAGALRLFALRLDGRVIAFHMTVEDQGVLHGIKRAYDESLRNYGPGLLLARSVLEHCFEDPRINRFDFSGEAEEHKTEWTDEAESQLQIEIFSPGVRTAASRAMVLSLWGAQEMVRRRIPVEIRERFDSSSPKAAVRSGAALIRTYVSACRTPSGRDRRSAEA